MLISIIVPVYNVEKYINECIDSILCQSFEDYEIILVDDGSTDQSGVICDAYQEQSDKIRVIHKKNGGLSDARNTGMKEAKGGYLLFVDSDDYIAEESLEKIVACLCKQQKAIDLMFLEATKIFPDHTSEPMGDGYQEKYINGQSKALCMQHLAELPKFPAAACTKLVRREFLLTNQLFFEKGLLSEDIDWTIRVLIKAEIFAYCPYNYYYYRQGRSGSITNTAGFKSADSLLWIIKHWGAKASDIPYQDEVNSFLAYEYAMLLMIYSRLDRITQNKVRKELQELKWILSYARTSKTKVIAFLCKFLDVHFVAVAICKLDRMRRFGLKIKRKTRR